MSKASVKKGGGEHDTSLVDDAEQLVELEVQMTSESSNDKRKAQIENSMAELTNWHVSRKECKAKFLRLFHHPHLDTLSEVFESQPYDGVIAVIVFFNLVLIIIETDCEGRGLLVPRWVDMVNTLILCGFVLEVTVKICVYQKSFARNFWNVLDFIIVGLDILSLILSAVLGGLPTLSIFRIVRLVRLCRSVKFLNMFPELGLMLSALKGAMTSLLWGLALLLLTLLIMAIMAVQLIHPINQQVASRGAYESVACDRCPHAFESVWMALLTIWQTDIAGDSWGLLALPISEEAPATWFLFVSVLVLLQLLLLNVILAAVLDSAQQARADNIEIMAKEREEEVKKFHKHLMKLCQELDEDGSGSLTYAEIVDGFKNNTEFFDIMEAMDIMPEDIASVWGILDRNHNGKVEYDEFANELFKMKSEDSHTMMVFIKYQVAEIQETVQAAISQLSSHTDMLNSLTCKKAEVLKQMTTSAGPQGDLQSTQVVGNLQSTQAFGSEDGKLPPIVPGRGPDLTSFSAELKIDQLAHVQVPEEPKLDTSMNTIIALEINALKVDLSRTISEKSRGMEDKMDATRRLLDALIETLPRQNSQKRPSWVTRSADSQVQPTSLAAQPVMPSKFQYIPPYCCTSGSSVADGANFRAV